MCPRITARNTRHAIALESAKYAAPSIGCKSVGTPGARMRAVAAIATPIVALMCRLDLDVSPCTGGEKLTHNKLVRSVTGPWINGVGRHLS